MMPYGAVAVLALTIFMWGLLLGAWLGWGMAFEAANRKIEQAARILEDAADKLNSKP